MKKIISLFLIVMFMSTILSYSEELCNEHLEQTDKIAKKAPTNIVKTDDDSIIVIGYNVVEATFAQDFSTKTANVGDKVDFLLNNGLQTKEGTEILPKGTLLNSEVIGIKKPKSFNRSGKVLLRFNYFETPDGKVYPIEAKLFNKEFLSRGKLNALGKGLGSTLGASAVGIGAGCGIGVAASAVIIGGFAIGLPIGFAIGAVAGLVTPGLHYKAKAGDKIPIQLTDDLIVSKN